MHVLVWDLVSILQDPLSDETSIKMKITRGSELVLDGQTSLKEMKRKPQELVDYLLRETFFSGCFFDDGYGIVPSTDFSLKSVTSLKLPSTQLVRFQIPLGLELSVVRLCR